MNRWSRRGVLRGLGVGGGLLAAGLPRLHAAEEKSDPYDKTVNLAERLETFQEQSDRRPEFVWTNYEDVLYHDMDLPAAVGDAPEFCAFVNDPVWVFNRSTRWLREAGTILCYDAAGELLLTGTRQISAWHSGRANGLSHDEDFTTFSKRSGRRRDAAVLPSLQFRIGQHPVLQLEVLEANTEWQLCITPKGRGGPPVISTGWQTGPATLTLDLEQRLLAAGFNWNYPELHFVLGTWNPAGTHASRVKFRASLAGRSAVAGCLPVVRTEQRAKQGVVITAVVLDEKANRLSASDVRVTAGVGNTEVPMTERDGVWQASLQKLPVGDHRVMIRSDGKVVSEGRCEVRITTGRFLAFDRDQSWVTRDGVPLGPLSGSFQGTLYFRHAGTPGEALVQGQHAWDSWDRSEAAGGEHMHFWESWTEEEMEERFAYIARSGFDLTTLHSHWGDWERLDAGGCIAPHGAEQLARYLRICGRHGLSHIQALASGPYATKQLEYGGTVPYSRYLEEGFQTSHYTNPGQTRFDELYHRYLHDFAELFADETALFAMTAAGEGDHFIGPARTNDTMRTVQSIDRNHVFLAETVLTLKQLPQEYNKGFEQARFGSRTYFIGEQFLPEADLGVHFKLLSMARMYLAEGSWANMPSYTRFHYEVVRDANGSPQCWTGTEHYRRRLRDTLYLGLMHRLPVMNSWDEAFAEDEHVILRQIRDLIDWREPFAEPPITVTVDNASANLADPGYARLIQLETALSRLGLMYRLTPYAAAVRKTGSTGDSVILDRSTAPQSLRYRADGGVLPDALRQRVPVSVSEGYTVSHCLSTNGRTLLAYVYNTTRHERKYYWLGGHYHRSPVATRLSIEVRMPASRAVRLRVYDLGSRSLNLDSELRVHDRFELGETASDYLIVATPLTRGKTPPA